MEYSIKKLVLQILETTVASVCTAVSFGRDKKHALACLLAVSIFPSQLFAAAGDTIRSTATITYDLGGVPTVSPPLNADFTEDRRINFTVTDSNGGSAVPVLSPMTGAVLEFVVQNNGNGVQDFLLTALNTTPNPYGTPTDSFNPALLATFVESGATPGYQQVEDTAVFVDDLAPSSSRVVYVVANIQTLPDNAVSAIALIAQVAEGGAAGEGLAINADDNGRVSPAGSYGNSSTSVLGGTPNTIADTVLGMETVFNDPAGLNVEDLDSAGAQDISGNGQHSDASAFQVAPVLIISKSVTVEDTLGGNDPHPGATLRYQLDVSVIGNTALNNLVITDAIPANTTYTDGSITLDGAVQTDLDDQPTDYSLAENFLTKPVTGIEVDLSENSSVAVPAGSSFTITFEVTID